MKNAYRLFRRKNRKYYIQDNSTGVQRSLATDDIQEATKLFNAKNEARQAPELNLQLGKVYLTNADPQMAKRTWGDAIEELSLRGKEVTQNRYKREFAQTRRVAEGVISLKGIPAAPAPYRLLLVGGFYCMQSR